jgi:protein-disulfide isomerase
MTNSHNLTALMALLACLACGALLVAAPEDHSVTTEAAEPRTVAVVGDIKITESELMDSISIDRQKAFESASKKIGDIEKQAMSAIFARRYVEQQAKASGLTEQQIYDREMAGNRDKFDSEFKSQIYQVRQQIYDAKRAALDDYVAKRLEEKTARDQGVTVEDLIKGEVQDKVAPVTQADIDQFYAQNQRNFGGQAKEAVSERIREQIRNQRITQRRNEYRASLRNHTPVKVELEVPRLAVPMGNDPIRGSKDAPVIIVLFADYECPYCSKLASMIDRVRENYQNSVGLVFRDFPLSIHQKAEKAAEAANCADQQGKFWEYHDGAMASQGQLAITDLKKRAEDLRLDMTEFNRCLDSGAMKEKIEVDVNDGKSIGVSSTPTAFINGRLIIGAQPYENFTKIIDDELAMKGIAVPDPQGAVPSSGTAKN